MKLEDIKVGMKVRIVVPPNHSLVDHYQARRAHMPRWGNKVFTVAHIHVTPAGLSIYLAELDWWVNHEALTPAKKRKVI